MLTVAAIAIALSVNTANGLYIDTREIQVGFNSSEPVAALEKDIDPTSSLNSSETSGRSERGCPRPSDLDVMYDDDKFLSACKWVGPGHDLALLGCTGQRFCSPQDTTQTDRPNYAYFVGSLVVMAGCTFTGFKETNYQGEKYIVQGPAIQSHVTFNSGFNHNHGDVGWFGSYVTTCEQSLPKCEPMDEWVTVGSLDNSQSAFPAEYTYQHTVGTQFTKSMQNSFQFSMGVEMKMKTSFFSFFEEKIGFSVHTGYDWKKVSTEAKSDAVTTQVKIIVPPFQKVKLDRATGSCGGSVVNTELMRTLSTSSMMESPRIAYWKDGNISL